MAVPSARDARLFYRCALARYEEAGVLLRSRYTTGAVYLAGYGDECILKALILAAVPAAGRADVLDSFRGNWGHSYEWLRDTYCEVSGARFPGPVARHFVLVGDWNTRLRYDPRIMQPGEAAAFLAAAWAIILWADGRLS